MLTSYFCHGQEKKNGRRCQQLQKCKSIAKFFKRPNLFCNFITALKTKRRWWIMFFCLRYKILQIINFQKSKLHNSTSTKTTKGEDETEIVSGHSDHWQVHSFDHYRWICQKGFQQGSLGAGLWNYNLIRLRGECQAFLLSLVYRRTFM